MENFITDNCEITKLKKHHRGLGLYNRYTFFLHSDLLSWVRGKGEEPQRVMGIAHQLGLVLENILNMDLVPSVFGWKKIWDLLLNWTTLKRRLTHIWIFVGWAGEKQGGDQNHILWVLRPQMWGQSHVFTGETEKGSWDVDSGSSSQSVPETNSSN